MYNLTAERTRRNEAACPMRIKVEDQVRERITKQHQIAMLGLQLAGLERAMSNATAEAQKHLDRRDRLEVTALLVRRHRAALKQEMEG